MSNSVILNMRRVAKCLMIVVLFSNISNAMMHFMPRKQLVATAEYIVVAKMQSVSYSGKTVRWRGGAGKIMNNELLVIESIKGSLLPGKLFVVNTLVFDEWMEDNVELPSKGSKVLLFLKLNKKGELKPVGGIQGVWSMQDGKLAGIGTGTTLEQVGKMAQKQGDEELAYAKSFAGKWNSTYGVMKLTVQGLRVSGNYAHDKGRIDAVLSQDGKTMKGTWAEAPSYGGSRDAGKMYFKLSSDAKKIDGTWSYGDAVPTHSWAATRFVVAQSQLPERVNPRHKLPKKLSIKKTDGSKYIGCYRDTTSKEGIEDRDLNGYYYINDSMSTKECATTCALKGFDYAGTQFSYVCFCGNSYGGNGAADNCNMPCSGSKNKICGGDLANSVYALTSTISSFVGTWSFGYSRHYGKQKHEHLYDLVLTDKHTKGSWLYHIRSCSQGFRVCTRNGLDYAEVHTCDFGQSFWLPREKELTFFGCDYQVTTFFTEVRPGYWEGVYVGGRHKGEDIVYYLEKKSFKETNVTHIKSNQVKDAENE